MSEERARKTLKFRPFQDMADKLPDLPDRESPEISEAATPVHARSHAPTAPDGSPPATGPTAPEDTPDRSDPLMQESLSPRFREHAEMEARRCMAEAKELERGNRWGDILALFFPLEEKAPAVVDAGMDLDLRLQVVFALGQAGRFEESLKCLMPALREHPDSFLVNSAAGFNAYQSLLKSRERKVRILPEERRERIVFAHRHFERCQAIRPDSVTAYYRQGMLFKEVEGKTFKATRCFQQAAANWEGLSAEEKERRHQERPKYVRSLYHLASCRLSDGDPRSALTIMDRCFQEDGDPDVISPVHRHFARAKCLNALGRFRDALDHLDTAAAAARGGEPTDYVWELAARCALALGDPDRGMELIGRIPERARRHYVRWTQADLLVALGKDREAEQVLLRSAERDRRSRHRALMRLARLHYRRGDMEKSLAHALAAGAFCRETFGNENHEALYWTAGCLCRLGRHEEATRTLEDLRRLNPHYPRLSRLEETILRTRGEADGHGERSSGEGERHGGAQG